MPTIRGHSLASRIGGIEVDRRGENWNVVQRDVDGDVFGDLAEVSVNAFRRNPVVKRRDDRDGSHAHRAVRIAGIDRLLRVRFGRARQHGHSSGRLVDDHLDDPASFGGREPQEFAGAAVGIKPVDAAFDQPVDVTAKGVLVDPPARVDGGKIRSQDASDGRHERRRGEGGRMKS